MKRKSFSKDSNPLAGAFKKEKAVTTSSEKSRKASSSASFPENLCIILDYKGDAESIKLLEGNVLSQVDEDQIKVISSFERMADGNFKDVTEIHYSTDINLLFSENDVIRVQDKMIFRLTSYPSDDSGMESHAQLVFIPDEESLAIPQYRTNFEFHVKYMDRQMRQHMHLSRVQQKAEYQSSFIS